MKILTFKEHSNSAAGADVISMANDADPREVSLEGVKRIDLHFPKFTDGRAYTAKLFYCADALVSKVKFVQQAMYLSTNWYPCHAQGLM
ncbi:MAG: hypothetical protein RL686_1719 [Pseudomonadota bacterium]